MVVVSPRSAPGQGDRPLPATRFKSLHVRPCEQVRTAVLHLRNPCILIGWALPSLFEVRFLRLRSRRARFHVSGLDPRRLGQTVRKLFIALSRIAPHDRAASPRWPPAWSHQCRSACPAIIRDQQANQHPGKHLLCVSTSINRRVREIVEWSVYLHPTRCPESAATQRVFNLQAIPRSDSMPSKYPDHQRPEIDPRRHARTTHLLGIVPCAKLLDECVESSPSSTSLRPT